MERRKADPELSARIDKSLDVCWKEGVVTQLMVGIFDYYLIPFALVMGASTGQIGFLVSFPTLIGAVSQFFSVRAMRIGGGRIPLLVKGVLLQALITVPLALLAVWSFQGRIYLLIVLMVLYRALGSVIAPAWGSLVSDYLPEHRRGQYFGWRARMVGISGMVGMGVWGFMLSGLKDVPETNRLCMLFLLAALFRFISAFMLGRMTDLPLHEDKESDFTFWMFIRRFRQSNFVKFVLYTSCIAFATHLSAPYISVYMLQDLKLDYFHYTAVHLASIVTGLISFPLWGSNADIFGNARVLKTTSLLIPIIPLLWVFATNTTQLILIEMFSGFIWGGFNLCAANFIFDAVSSSKRVRCLGYFNVINGTAAFFGAALGGYLASHLPPFRGSPLLMLFLISAILRFAAHFLLEGHFKEVRTSRHINSVQLFLSVLKIRPLSGGDVEPQVMPMTAPFKWRNSDKTAPVNAVKK